MQDNTGLSHIKALEATNKARIDHIRALYDSLGVDSYSVLSALITAYYDGMAEGLKVSQQDNNQ